MTDEDPMLFAAISSNENSDNGFGVLTGFSDAAGRGRRCCRGSPWFSFLLLLGLSPPTHQGGRGSVC